MSGKSDASIVGYPSAQPSDTGDDDVSHASIPTISKKRRRTRPKLLGDHGSDEQCPRSDEHLADDSSEDGKYVQIHVMTNEQKI